MFRGEKESISPNQIHNRVIERVCLFRTSHFVIVMVYLPRPPHPSASQTPSPQGEGLRGRNALLGSSPWKGFVRKCNEIYGIRNMSLPLEGKVPNGVRRMRWSDFHGQSSFYRISCFGSAAVRLIWGFVAIVDMRWFYSVTLYRLRHFVPFSLCPAASGHLIRLIRRHLLLKEKA